MKTKTKNKNEEMKNTNVKTLREIKKEFKNKLKSEDFKILISYTYKRVNGQIYKIKIIHTTYTNKTLWIHCTITKKDEEFISEAIEQTFGTKTYSLTKDRDDSITAQIYLNK